MVCKYTSYQKVSTSHQCPLQPCRLSVIIISNMIEDIIKPGEGRLPNEPRNLKSPNGKLELRVGIDDGSTLWYELSADDKPTIGRSKLALYDTQDRNLLQVEDAIHYRESTRDETWEQPWGEQRFVRDNHNELALETTKFTIRFRLFDDSFGFRYELAGEESVTITREATEFNIGTEATAWWIPALGQNHYEHLYKQTTLSEIATAHTPLTIEMPDNRFMTIHEAALYDYGSMNLVPTENGLTSSITPLKNGDTAHIILPFTMPWRTVIIADKPADLGKSKIMLNLNEPSKIEDTSWIKPTKFMGIWWGMFIGYFTWESGPKHGATTRNAFRYINAAKHFGIRALLIEGWNEGWDGDWTQNGDKMNHMQPYRDFDIHAVTSYAKSQGIDIIGHHETSGNISHYEWQLPEAYDYYRHLGVRYIKTGYVQPRMNTGDPHSSQVGVKHYQRTVQLAAERKIMLDIHEPVKGTGIERTWPNLMTREGVMGQEYEGGAVTPEHTTVLPFTRLLAGPLDYTPGLFNLTGTERKVYTTLAKQLAYYVTMYSPMQMAADLPEHYEGQAAFQFIRDVPINWDQTLPLDGVIGDYYVVARKDRDSDDWYIGAVSDENERTIDIKLDFLPEHQHYQATIYRDDTKAHWQDNPEAHQIEHRAVVHGDSLSIYIAPGGGFAVRLTNKDVVAYPYPT